MTDCLKQLENNLGHVFSDQQLVVQALTHKSFSNEQPGFVPHNERLEFLGDAVLELAISDLVFRRFPEIPEGGLTRIRSEVVSEKGLSDIARTLQIGQWIRLGRGELNNGGQEKPSLVADAFEALLGAVYQDAGFAKASLVIERVFSDPVDASAQLRYGSDHKTCLQERMQARFNELPDYRLSQVSGPDHNRVFFMEVYFQDKLVGRGSGTSKKSAEQQAAAAALDHPMLRE